MFSSGDGGVGDGDSNPATQQCFTNDGRNQTKFIPGFPASSVYLTSMQFPFTDQLLVDVRCKLLSHIYLVLPSISNIGTEVLQRWGVQHTYRRLLCHDSLAEGDSATMSVYVSIYGMFEADLTIIVVQSTFFPRQGCQCIFKRSAQRDICRAFQSVCFYFLSWP